MVLGKRKRNSQYGSNKRRRRFYMQTAPRTRTKRYTKIHNFTRMCQLSNIATNNATQASGGITFKLSDLPNYTEFTNLFDQFRINAVLIKIEPTFTGSDLNPVTSQFILPNIHTAIDHNDITAPTTLNDLMEQKTYKSSRGHMIHKRYFKPAVQVRAYESVASDAYCPKWKQWVSTDDFTTPHYGFKYWIDAPTTATYINYRVYVKLYFQCKDVK